MHLSFETAIALYIIRARWHRDFRIFVACPRASRATTMRSCVSFSSIPRYCTTQSRLKVSYVYISSPSCSSRSESRSHSNHSVCLLSTYFPRVSVRSALVLALSYNTMHVCLIASHWRTSYPEAQFVSHALRTDTLRRGVASLVVVCSLLTLSPQCSVGDISSTREGSESRAVHLTHRIHILRWEPRLSVMDLHGPAWPY